MSRAPFKFSARTRVGFSDTDAQGIVYYGRYNPYFDLARVEYLRARGLLRHESGAGAFVMRANDVEYFAPARFDDELEIHARVSRIGRTSITFEFAAYKMPEEMLLVTAHQTLVLVDLDERKALPVPDDYRGTSSRSKATMPSTSDALEAVDRILDRGGDADDILREVITVLHDRAGYAWAGIFFVEGSELVLGPHAGSPDESRRTTIPVSWQGERIAELAIDDAPEEDRMFLERVAVLVSGHCLVGWDTGGESWEP